MNPEILAKLRALFGGAPPGAAQADATRVVPGGVPQNPIDDALATMRNVFPSQYRVHDAYQSDKGGALGSFVRPPGGATPPDPYASSGDRRQMVMRRAGIEEPTVVPSDPGDTMAALAGRPDGQYHVETTFSPEYKHWFVQRYPGAPLPWQR